jgi:L-seryl-tRNA(Ser) seleniumtransferase
VHRFLSDVRVAAYEPLIGRENCKRAIANLLGEARASGASSFAFEDLVQTLLLGLHERAAEGLTGVINATGILLHTNLGRAPIAPEALEAAALLGSGYSNLEYDLHDGQRGSRYSRVSHLLQEVTGAQDGIVVNNCAAAVLLILDTFAKGREVVIARNELIEIGGGFRLPDVFARSGAQLVEVGAANKVYLSDYERALSAQSALLFRSHLSNFRIVGFTQTVTGSELCELGERCGIPVVEDLGSGAVIDLQDFGLPHERTVQDALADGMQLVAFSADKLLGGPQAGIIVGSGALIARLRANPLIRALRIDKIAIALLAETLRLYLSADGIRRIPFYAMLSATTAQLRERAARYTTTIAGASVIDSEAFIGGGSLPQSGIASIAVALEDRTGTLAERLRKRTPPVVGRTGEGRLMLDLRTIAPHEDELVVAALAQAM